MRKGVRAPEPARKPVPLSEWVQAAPGAPVTRAQLAQFVRAIVERRFMVEAVYRREQRWYRRLWRFLTKPAAGNSRAVRQEDFEKAAAAALDPSTTEVAVGPGARPK
jgi:hypothetical protein